MYSLYNSSIANGRHFEAFVHQKCGSIDGKKYIYKKQLSNTEGSKAKIAIKLMVESVYIM